MSEIYKAAEDSYFFLQFLKETIKKVDINFLDMGSGSCILGETAKEIGIKNITCVDINPKAVELAKIKGFKSIHSNLFENINGKYDIITFNAPYLPYDKREPKTSQLATTGGKFGDEISLEFLKESKKHLNKNGKIYLLISSLTPLNRIKKFKPKTVAKKKIPFEELMILEIS